MRQDEFERRRRILEEQLEKDLELVREAYRVKLRALEALQSAATAGEPGFSPSESRGETPAPAGPVRRRQHRLVEKLEEAWHQLPAEFDKHDLYRILGYQPPRATVDRAISELLLRKKIMVRWTSGGRHPSKYQKAGEGVRADARGLSEGENPHVRVESRETL